MKYSGNNLKEISFPLGGIGTGSIGLAGNGALIDWEIFNRPNKGGLNEYSHFAIKAEYPDGTNVVKILQGDQVKDLTGKYTKLIYCGFGYGPFGGTMSGFPHFKNVEFDGEFPIATITFTDDNFPALVILKAFNPFIPLDADNSSIPAAFFEVSVESERDDVKYTVICSVRNPFEVTKNEVMEHPQYTAVKMVHNDKTPDDKEYGDLTVAVSCKDNIHQEYWYRGAWQDKITTFWRDLTDNDFNPRHYDESSWGDVCSVGAVTTLNKGESKAFRFVISWNVPNNYNYWNPQKDEKGEDILWKNYYATLFENSTASAFYCLDNWDMLYSKTERFRKSLHGTTLDGAVIEAISGAISVLKSPTVLRLQDGTFWAWEGVHELEGSCEGTCTHVWSYAYALCFLFPELERSLRNTEFKYDTDEHGRMYFRTHLPLGTGQVVQPPCVDGQMATVIKIYRDWKITGNTDWLKENWENIKKILEYAWSEHNDYKWDADKDGVLEGRQHHTLDMELFGPSSWLEGMYLGALKAAAEMAEFLGDTKKAKEYLEIFEKGKKWTAENLFNGEYFYHKVDLYNKGYTEKFNCPEYWNEEKGQLKYQISEGCEIDQLLGQWHANNCGLGEIFQKPQMDTALKSMMKYNFKSSLREMANMWRIFAINDEAGTIMCDYPDGHYKPVIPISYCEECMSGFEYSFAGLLISEGFVEDGIKVIKAIRDRYDGEKRNPWNEIECGSNYARPMANFALLPIFSGFEFDLPRKHIGFAPILDGVFKSIWNLGTAWGDFEKEDSGYTITLADGYVVLKSLSVGNLGAVKSLVIDGKKIPFTQKDKTLFFDEIKIEKEIRVEI